MTDTLQLNLGTGGSTLAVNDLAGGEVCQYVKLLSGADASETVINAGNGTAANGLLVTVASDSTGQIALAAGTASVGTVGLNTSTTEIGKTKTEGKVSHDSDGTSIAPLLQGAIAYASDGTAPGTDVAEGDLTRLKATLDGRLYVSDSHPYAWDVSADYAAAQSDTTIKPAAGAGLSLYITDIFVSNGAVAGNVTLLDGAAGTVKFETYMAVNSNVTFSPRTPIRLTANTLLAITSTSSTTHSVTICGYTAG